MKQRQRWKRWCLGLRKNCEVDCNFYDGGLPRFCYSIQSSLCVFQVGPAYRKNASIHKSGTGSFDMM